MYRTSRDGKAMTESRWPRGMWRAATAQSRVSGVGAPSGGPPKERRTERTTAPSFAPNSRYLQDGLIEELKALPVGPG